MSRPFCTNLFSLLPLLVIGISGCSSLNLSDGLKWPDSEAKPQIPNEIVDVWTDDILHQTGQPSKRGFGGRLMFYNQESETPVKVEGALTIYLFDDRAEDPVREDPIHKYVFPADTLEKHYSKSKLGHSYSFWLPVDDVGGIEKKLTVIARFEPTLGGRILAKPSTHVLPGRPAVEQPTSPLVQRFEARNYEKKANGEIQQVAHIEPVRDQGITTATINLPPAFAQQMMNSPAQSAFGVPITTPGTPAVGAMPANRATFNPRLTGVPSAAQVPATGPGQASVGTQPSNATLASLPPVHSQHSRFPVRRGALGRPVASRVRTQPLRARWPSALPSTPRAAPLHESPTIPTNAATTMSPWREQQEW